MYKFLFVALVLLSAVYTTDFKPTGDLGTKLANTVEAISGVNLATPVVVAHVCNNRFSYTGFQVAKDCKVCVKGTHEKNGKCIGNLDGCSTKVLDANSNCKDCKFWYWASKSTLQGNYCYNRWWVWVIIFFSSFAGLVLLLSMVTFFTHWGDATSKKQKSTSSKTTKASDKF